MKTIVIKYLILAAVLLGVGMKLTSKHSASEDHHLVTSQPPEQEQRVYKNGVPQLMNDKGW